MTRLKVSVFSWDMGHNALGRAYVVADLLRRSYDVEIVGAHFVNTGSELWQPLRNASIPMRRFDGTSLPKHFSAMESMARRLDSDVLYATKPRLPSMGLGILAKEHRNRPLLFDCDDREVSFFEGAQPCDLAQVARRRTDPDFAKPFGRTWTQHCESLLPCGDGLTVSNVALQELLGGTIIPHARDEQVFDPARYDRAALRDRFGLAPDERAIMFAGTPRAHKGLGEIAAALEAIGDRRNRLCVFGTTELGRLGDELRDYGHWLHELPYQSFDRLPEAVVCADLVCVLQDTSSEISTYQIPAKITDALALGVPCLVRRVASIEPLVAADAIEVLEPDDDLTDAIARVLAEGPAARERALARREVFLTSYSYEAVRPVIERQVEEALERPAPLHPKLEELLAFHRSEYSSATLAHPPARRRSAALQVARRQAEVAEQTAALAHGEVQRFMEEIRRQNAALDVHVARRAEIEGLREMVAASVHETATVAVVSKGDPDLVRLGNRRTRHFPSDAQGAYAGYHPADSDDAIEHLRAVLEAGAEFLVVPKSAFWWRSQYPGFWRHIVETCTLVEEDDEVGAIFATVGSAR